ncbi:hypothetical protein [Rhizobium terrae]|uniref:hypothetical protein n=1 Tax=Rhizobium terrae TaxID=2171756 RepID=UPI000E3CDD54|nr:hypothetical protein [Rhizobium terrae]
MSADQDLTPATEREFGALLQMYQVAGALDAIAPSASLLSKNLKFYTEFAFYLGEKAGYRVAIEFCDLLVKKLSDADRKRNIGVLLIVEAQFFDELGIGMSRDLFALEAAEAFVRSGQYRAAQTALKLVAA